MNTTLTEDKTKDSENYDLFLKTKIKINSCSGFELDDNEIIPQLFDYQKKIVKWACKAGKAAIFADTGLGKTAMFLNWARAVNNRTNKGVLIVAPLAVTTQIKLEGEKFGIQVFDLKNHLPVAEDVHCEPFIWVLNYEQIDKINFIDEDFAGVVLDESSILKNFSGKVRNQLIEKFKNLPYKLACTATPSPNDYMELGNHAEFLDVMSHVEMLATFFVHDGGDTSKWRLKRHARADFWRWMASWSIALRKPSDLGFSDDGYQLPELIQESVMIETPPMEGKLFNTEVKGLLEQKKVKRETLELRVKKAVEIIESQPDENWIIWCELNDESELLAKALNATEIKGSDKPEIKEQRMIAFTKGEIKRLVSKPSICGFGMNWQHCSRMLFIGVSHSFEQTYQAIRRCWRFGQKRDVQVFHIVADLEGSIVQNLQRKEKEFNQMINEVVNEMSEYGLQYTKKETKEYKTNKVEKSNFTACLGDSCEVIKEIESNSVDYSIFSPPFASLYTYSDSNRDMGNCSSDDDFYQHFRFLIRELYRVLAPGRLLSFHCMNLPASKQNDGYIGIKDFRGNLIRDFQEAGFIYHSEVVIWKDPVVAMQRTKSIGLLHKQLKKDSALSRQGIPDYLVTMRKPGVNEKPVTKDNESFPVSLWQRYASPVWMDINPSNTLQYKSARDHADEKHICPLQLQVIERALRLWTNPGDLVLSPFMGIGSEGYEALRLNRRFVGIELKESYFNQAVKNLQLASESSENPSLLDLLPGSETEEAEESEAV